MLAKEGTRDALVAAGAPVRSAWLGSTGHAAATIALRDVDSFAIDIDDGEIFPVDDTGDSSQLGWQPSPELRAIARRIDGEMLDAIRRAHAIGPRIVVRREAGADGHEGRTQRPMSSKKFKKCGL